MNIGIILMSTAGLIAGASLIINAIQTKGKPKWIIKAHSLGGLFAIIGSLLTIFEQVWGQYLTDKNLTALKTYDSIFFGLFGGVLLTLWLSGHVTLSNDEKRTGQSNNKTET